jgi:hypothetical protein
MIYGGPSMRLSTRQHKRERREVFSVQLTTPLFLDWSEMAITFDRDDHPDYVPNLGVYPLVVDPIIANTRLTKVLMDGGNSLNIIYAQTLDLLGITRTHLRPSVGGFHGVVLGKRAEPVGRSTCLSVSTLPPTSGRRLSHSKWLDFMEHTTPSLGAHATPDSWRSLITPTSSSKCQAPTVS